MQLTIQASTSLKVLIHKSSFFYYRSANYAKFVDLRENGVKMTIFPWYVKLTKKPSLGCYESSK